MTLVLASSSPRRRELLNRVGIAFEVVPASLDESVQPGEGFHHYAQRVALAKAEVVMRWFPERWVLAADTVVALGDNIFGKPKNKQEAEEMLRILFGNTHVVSTAFALCGPGAPSICEIVTTQVAMRKVHSRELSDYLECGEWEGKAGAYAIQGIAAAFVTEIHGSVTNVIGLPLAQILTALAQRGIYPAYRAGVPA